MKRKGGAVSDTAPDPAGWTCPLPLRNQDRVVLGHGGGGKMMGELIEHLFLPAFGAAAAGATATDSATIDLGDGTRLAFTTDSFVVRPMFFPGGNLGELAVYGTVNDLAMAGAAPLALSTGFILEEGTEIEVLGRVAAAMGAAAERVGVRLATGDTKVVERGHGDGIFVNTAGIGLIPEGVDLVPTSMRPGDAVIVSGPIGLHGVAVLSVREGLEFGTDIESDTAPLHELVASMLAAAPDGGIRTLRDLTRGGLGAALCELSSTAQLGVEFVENDVPVPDSVRAACGFLGLDPLHVANEGTLVAVVAPEAADAVLEAMSGLAVAVGARRIGTITEDHPGVVVARTGLGAGRVVDLPLGEQLPRIC